MSLGERLQTLRKNKKLSQEEVAEKLNVTRQTVSKWELDQSMPDFDKIIPLCELYEIDANELLTGNKKESLSAKDQGTVDSEALKKRAKGIALGVFLYIISVISIIILIPVFKMNPLIAVGIFIAICAVATYIIVYTNMVYKKEIKAETRDPLEKQINSIIGIIFSIIYLLVSFLTMAWHITWILWVVYGLITEIIKLIFMLRRGQDEE